ncbi:Uncharacterised protein [Streptococcus pneumoniae]|nr:hypothetical protein [Bacillus cereus]CGG56936.1 Uncharacterised protein [Streptococcus pneumoniae]COF47365.1 Uncharacterised protein [Streptococcus pneumoniae]COF68148.1 Uncharacterised protein [Streptococcus pneumoniae]COG04069.1 Uncharacterised protein [Streptococcus pneumoniae]
MGAPSIAPINTPGAFTLNGDGSITINIAGIYNVIGSVSVAPGNSGTFGIQINGGGIAYPFLQSFGNITTIGDTSSTQLNRNCILNLNVGDTVSIGLIFSNPSPLSLALLQPNPGNASPTVSSLTFIQLS